jgi:hypothetical protein
LRIQAKKIIDLVYQKLKIIQQLDILRDLKGKEETLSEMDSLRQDTLRNEGALHFSEKGKRQPILSG